MLHRRTFLAVASLALASAPSFAADRRRVVTILGDSITAGYGLPAAQALPARLQAALDAAHARAVVRGAGVSGDTTAGGLARVDFSVQSDTALCVVALGGNDLLQGQPARSVEANLDRIVTRLQARRIKVLVAGLVPPPAIGRAYAAEFAGAFGAVARKHGVRLYPDLLAGVGPELRQRDGIHPDARGADVIARRLAPVVLKALGA